MANAAITQTQIDNLVAKLQYHKYLVAINGGSISLGPLNSPPKIEPDVETKDTVLYENGSEPVASIISKYDATITLEVEDVDTAIQLLGGTTFAKGVNILGGTGTDLTLVPLTNDATAKTLTFPRVYLQPGLSTNFAEGDDPNYITLTFTAKPKDGVLFTFAVV